MCDKYLPTLLKIFKENVFANSKLVFDEILIFVSDVENIKSSIQQ